MSVAMSMDMCSLNNIKMVVYAVIPNPFRQCTCN